ncbi:uncharacterized protein PHACADRAFT_253780 [Phanerochaete carnosa HHB-10118-sp]|uniref:Uncharacterized protein n=1 Tax=Phanerochaete carnosa (strain HHB-10118-sp) TaxID=650164 RepID=K5X1C5_PHACS|nr:uncharacterized protein PHACADRAFT_253780 [Phanerochaete carnosa HHB-10118-sp]EKM56572.1 hypothetical protein PHACADRAFT_253780 [Phanerochaete carnosa HHB-10118-sp]
MGTDVRDLGRTRPVIQCQHWWMSGWSPSMAWFCPRASPGLAGTTREVDSSFPRVRLACDLSGISLIAPIFSRLGGRLFDNKHTPRDHFVTARVTVGEDYHRF